MNEELMKDMFNEHKRHSKRDFVLIVILILALLVANLVWLYVYNLPQETYTESYDLTGDNGSNVFYNGQGQVQIDGEEK